MFSRENSGVSHTDHWLPAGASQISSTDSGGKRLFEANCVSVCDRNHVL